MVDQAAATGRELRVLRAHNRAQAPWKNGGGITREVAAGPAGAGLDDFSWRVSLAEVGQGGPFSSFAGVDRVIALVEGAGMELTVDGFPHPVAAPFRPFAFPGDATTTCRLIGGPLVDFNVMTRRTEATAQVHFACADFAPEDFALSPRQGELILVIALLGTVTFDEPGVTLGRFDAALLSGGGAGADAGAGGGWDIGQDTDPGIGREPAPATGRGIRQVRVEGAAAIVTLTPVPGSSGL
ncbi:HutD family protein [Streptomyces sp. NPDC059398]|uniref:HutD/Ves family protein n=1 Tax=Streptomyces sp. NPDC059398 TaxID=3346820 RepID=UPI003694B572